MRCICAPIWVSLSPKSRQLIWIVDGGSSHGFMFNVGRVFDLSGSSSLSSSVSYSMVLSQLLSSQLLLSSRFCIVRPGIESVVCSLWVSLSSSSFLFCVITSLISASISFDCTILTIQTFLLVTFSSFRRISRRRRRFSFVLEEGFFLFLMWFLFRGCLFLATVILR